MTTSLLAAFSRDIEDHAEHARDRPMVLAAVQRGDHLPASARARYRRLAQSCALVAVFGRDASGLGADLRSVALHADDPLRQEWTLITLGSHTASALIARELPNHDAESDADRRFAVMTTDRALVAAAASNLLTRMP